MTEYELESFLYDNVKSAIGSSILGNVYKSGMRPIYEPMTSHKEDAVVIVSTGTHAQLQKAVCLVNVYVPDVIVSDGRSLEDKVRCGEIANLLKTLPSLLTKAADGRFVQTDMLLTIEEPDTKEHFVSLKMDFMTIQDNY